MLHDKKSFFINNTSNTLVIKFLMFVYLTECEILIGTIFGYVELYS